MSLRLIAQDNCASIKARCAWESCLAVWARIDIHLNITWIGLRDALDRVAEDNAADSVVAYPSGLVVLKSYCH
jgi:hypothetical protein